MSFHIFFISTNLMLDISSTKADVLPLIIFIFSFRREPALPEKKNCKRKPS